MGFRTLVLLHNDQAHLWQNDPQLGKKIALAMNFVNSPDEHGADYRSGLADYGRVVECVHADTQTLAVVDGYSYKPIAYSNWMGETEESLKLKMVKQAAAQLGFRLVRKRNKP